MISRPQLRVSLSSSGEEEEERILDITPTAPPPVGAASPLKGEAERDILFP